MNRIPFATLTLSLSLAPILCWATEPNTDRTKAVTEIDKPGRPVADTGSASAKGLSAVRSFLAAAAKEAGAIVDDQEREYVMYDLAAMQAMVGDIEKAKAAASACSIRGRRSEACRYIGEIQGALGDKDRAGKMLVLARKAALTALSPDKKERSWVSIGLVAIEQARIGDFQGASETLQFIDDAKSREEYQASIAHFQTGPEARKAMRHVNDPFQRDLVARDIVNQEASAGNLTAAWASAKDIVDLGLRTSAYVAVAEAEGYDREARKRAYTQAKKTAEQLRGAEDSTAFRAIPASGDSEFHEIATSQAQTGDIDGAKATAASLKDPTEKAAAFVDVARSQTRASDRRGARITLANAVEARASGAYDERFMRQLAAALAEAGDLAEAMKTVSLIGERGESRDHAYEEVIDVLLDEHQIKQARETVALLSDPRWKATALARIGAAESSAGDIAAARKTFAEARSVAATAPAKSRESYEWDRSSVYHYVAMRQSEGGDFDEIKRWIPFASDPRDRVHCWLGAACPLADRYYDESRKKIAEKAEKTGAARPK